MLTDKTTGTNFDLQPKEDKITLELDRHLFYKVRSILEIEHCSVKQLLKNPECPNYLAKTLDSESMELDIILKAMNRAGDKHTAENCAGKEVVSKSVFLNDNRGA